MAITVNDKQQIISPAYNPNVIVATSTNNGQSGFTYLFDVYSANTSNRFARVRIPNDSNGKGIYNCSKLLSSFVGYNFNQNLTGFSNPSSSYVNYDIQIGESYIAYHTFYDNYFSSGGYVGFSGTMFSSHTFEVGDRVTIEQEAGYTYSAYNSTFLVISAYTNGIVVDYSYLGNTPVNSGTCVFADHRKTIFSGLDRSISGYMLHNAAIPVYDFINYDFNTYNLRTGTTGYFYTVAQSPLKIKRTNNCLFNVISSANTNCSFLHIITENTSGLIQEYRISKGAGSFSALTQIGIGAKNLSGATATPLLTGYTLPIIQSDTSRYTAYTENNLSAITSNKFVFEIDSFCSRFVNIELIFLDSKGSFVPFNFDMVSRKNISVNSTEYKKSMGYWNGTSWGYGYGDRGGTIINNVIDEEIVANTNWITEAQSTLFSELIKSPEVYWNYNDSGNYIPVILSTKTVEVRNKKNSKLISYDIRYRVANNSLVQINS